MAPPLLSETKAAATTTTGFTPLEESANQDQLVQGPSRESMPEPSRDGYEDGTKSPLERDLTTTTADDFVEGVMTGEIQDDESTTTVGGELAQRARKTPPPLVREFLQDAPHGKMEIRSDGTEIKGSATKSTQKETFSVVMLSGTPPTDHPNAVTDFAKKFESKDGMSLLVKPDTKEEDILDFDILTIHYFATNEELADFPKGRQLGMHDALYGKFDSQGRWHTYDRRVIVQNLSDYRVAHLGQGATGGKYAYLDDPLDYAKKQLEKKEGNPKEREAALKAIVNKVIDKDAPADSRGQPKMDEKSAWALAYKTGFAKSAKDFTKAVGGSTGDGSTLEEDREKLLEGEETPAVDAQGIEGALEQSQDAKVHAAYEIAEGLVEDIETGEALDETHFATVKEKGDTTTAAVEALKAENNEASFKAYCEAMGIEQGTYVAAGVDTPKGEAQKQLEAARMQQEKVEPFKKATEHAEETGSNADLFDVFCVKQAKLDAERVPIGKKTGKEKTTGLEALSKKEEALKKEMSEVKYEDGTPVFDEQAKTEFAKSAAARTTHQTTLRKAATEAETARVEAQKEFAELEKTGHFVRLSRDHAEATAEFNAAETRRNNLTEEEKARATAAYAQEQFDAKRDEHEEALSAGNLSEAEKHDHEQEIARLTREYEALEDDGQHGTRIQRIAEIKEDVSTAPSRLYDALSMGDEKGAEAVFNPKDKKGNPLYEGTPDYDVTLTEAGRKKWQEEHSKHAKTMKTVDKVIAPFTKGGEALSTVSQGVDAVDGIAKVFEGPENTAGTAQVTAIHSEKVAKRAALAAERAKRQDIKTSLREFISGLRERKQTTIQTALAEGITGEDANRAGRIKNRYVSILDATFGDDLTPDDKGALTEAQVEKTEAEAEKTEALAQISQGRASAVMV